MSSELSIRSPASGEGWTEHFLNKKQASATVGADGALSLGHSVIVLHELATEAECEALRVEAASAACTVRSEASSRWNNPDDPGRIRFPILEALKQESQDLCDRLLLRAVAQLRAALPPLIPKLFGQAVEETLCGEKSTICRNELLRFSPREPAVNVYESGGWFKPHKDEEALTVLLPLTGAEHFSGGGTAFYSVDDLDPVQPCKPTSSEPTLTLTPAAGAALIFTGRVVHGAVKVLGGERCVFVASFSASSVFVNDET